MLVVVGTRGSPLAMTQTKSVVEALRRRYPAVEFSLREIRTTGDLAAEAPMRTLPRGLFAKELEAALASGEIDMAVHSFKDLPTELAPGLSIAAICEREDPRDVLVTPGKRTLAQLPAGSRLGTSAPRRLAQLKARRSDLQIVAIRGNVGTRIRKALEGEVDGVVLAAAGIRRLGLEAEIAEYLEPEVSLPAVGQGALAIEVRADDRRMIDIAGAADHRESRIAVTAEMAVLRRLGGGCRTPIAAYARLEGSVRQTLLLQAMVASSDGQRMVRGEARGPAADAAAIGDRLAKELLDQGAGAILEEEA